MKRFLFLMLALLMAVTLLVACDEGGTEIPDESNDGNSDVIADDNVVVDDVVICLGKETEYTIVYPDGVGNDYIDVCKTIAQKITDLGGKMRVTNDWTRNVEATAANHEILIGNTNRPETLEVMNSIGYDDYAIRQVGNKVVVTAHNEARLLDAIEYFCSTSLKSDTIDGKAAVVCEVGYQFKGDKQFFINHDNPLAGYRIVSSSNKESVDTAKLLAEAIKTEYGVELEVVTDSTSAVEREIVIGKTNRAVSKYINKDNPFVYTIKADGKTLFIGAEENSANSYVVKSVIKTFVTSDFDNTLNFPADYEESGTIGNFVDKAELADGADIRVFSFNVLFNNTLKDPTPEERSIALGAIMAYFSPDVIGLQEMNEPWHSLFPGLDSRYAIVDRTNGAGKMNNSCIAYNTEKAKLLDHGIKIYSQGDRPHLRLANWAYFEDIDSGKKYIVINTHWDIVDEYVMTQAEEMGKLVQQLVEKYNCPVISTGDYNKTEKTPEYKKYVELAGLSDSKFTAAVKGNVHKTSHGFSPLGTKPSTTTVESIDHVLGNNKVEFLYFTVLVDQIVLDCSDHCPIYADIKLK